jgi:hypothetical protein
MSSSLTFSATGIAHNPTAALDVLLLQLFDYAGMFPPAQRSFQEALEESASLSQTLARPWLVGSDLVLDTASVRRLRDVDLKAVGFANELLVSVLATETLNDVKGAVDGCSAASVPVKVSAFELKVPGDGVRAAIDLWYALAASHGALLALEPDLAGENWQSVLSETVSVIAKSGSKVALKCRLTGPTGIGAERLAQAITLASDLKIQLKVTGGLHHPIVSPELHSYPMGFVNVTAAGMLKRALGTAVTTPQLVELLTNASWSRFVNLIPTARPVWMPSTRAWFHRRVS